MLIPGGDKARLIITCDLAKKYEVVISDAKLQAQRPLPSLAVM